MQRATQVHKGQNRGMISGIVEEMISGIVSDLRQDGHDPAQVIQKIAEAYLRASEQIL